MTFSKEEYINQKRNAATEYFKQGYNCSQAVLAAFIDEIKFDFNVAMRLASSFGGGMGRLREVCGTVSAMFMVLGISLGYDEAKAFDKKTEHYALIQDAAELFKKDHSGTIICRDLLGLNLKPNEKDDFVPEKRTDEYYKKRPCVKIVGDAAELTAKILIDKMGVL